MLAYVVQQQFLFPLAELDPIFWILVGMLVVRTPDRSARTDAPRAAGWSCRSRGRSAPG